MRRLLLAFAVVSSLAGVMVSAASASPTIGCQLVTAHGQTQATSPTTFAGTATVTVDGNTYSDVPVTTATLGPPSVGRGGVLLATTSHVFELPTGTIRTLDSAVLVPTGQPGVYRLFTRAQIVSGGVGVLIVTGTINFAAGPPTAEWSAFGVICN